MFRFIEKGFIVLLLISSVLSGCTVIMLPMTKENILAAPIHIQLPPASDNTKLISKEDFIQQAVIATNNEDNLALQKAREMAENYYFNEYENSEPANIRILAALNQVFSRSSDYMYFLVAPKGAYPPLNLRYVDNSKLKASGSLSAHWYDGIQNTYDGRADFKIGLKQNESAQGLAFEISSLGYFLDCSYQNVRGYTGRCSSTVFEVLENNLIKKLSQAVVAPQKTPISVDQVKKSIKTMLESRYIMENDKANKIEQNYPTVDFTTAKARIQRTLDKFKYDSEGSVFSLEDGYTNNMQTVKHRYVLSLFPEEKGTVVVFSGDYGYLKDSFGGADLFGKSAFDKEMAEIKAKVDAILDSKASAKKIK